MTTFVIQGLSNALRRTQSLIALHLSGNPGMSDDTKDAFAKRIICRPNEVILRFTRIENLIKQALKDQPAQPVEAVESKMNRTY